MASRFRAAFQSQPDKKVAAIDSREPRRYGLPSGFGLDPAHDRFGRRPVAPVQNGDRTVSTSKRLGCLSFGLLFVLLAGCGEDTQLAVRTNWYIADIPVPKGFERNVNESSYKADGKARRILDVYEGGADPIKVRNFYKTNMASQQWVFENESLAGAIYTLNYTKGTEKCTITVGRTSDKGLFNKTEIRVNIEGK